MLLGGGGEVVDLPEHLGVEGGEVGVEGGEVGVEGGEVGVEGLEEGVRRRRGGGSGRG